MESKDLEDLYKSIEKEFGTLIRVEVKETDSKSVINLSFKSYGEKNPDDSIDIESRINESQDEFADYSGINGEMIEIFEVLGTAKSEKFESDDFLFFSKFLHNRTRLQLIFIPSEDSVIVVLRSFLSIIEDREKLKNEIILTLKDFLAYHYLIKYNQLLTSIYKTLDDEEMIDSLVNKHKSGIKALLNPDTTVDF